MPATATIFQTEAPSATHDQIVKIIGDHYGIAVSRTQRFPSERDFTCHVMDELGRDFVLKIANRSDDAEIIAFQDGALQHVEKVDPAIPLPRVIRSASNQSEVRARLGGQEHTVRLLSFLQGYPAIKVEATAAIRRSLGRELGRLSAALKSYSHPADEHVFPWDLKNADLLLDKTECIEDIEKRRLVEANFRWFDDHVAPYRAALRSQVVHNDLHLQNVLLDDATRSQIVGIIDFGDIVRTALVFDVAIALSSHLSLKGHPLAFAAELLAGFQKEYPLLPEEIELLFGLIGVRHAMVVTITELRSMLYPEHRDYIMRNNPRATLALKKLREIDHGDAKDYLAKACSL